MENRKQTLGFLLARASYAMSTKLNTLLKREGIDLPHSQYILLKTLYEDDGISQQELANRVYKNAAAVKRTLDILENKELVKRVPITLRKNSIVITNKGKKMIPVVLNIISKWETELLEGVESDKYSLFKDFLNTIYYNTLE